MAHQLPEQVRLAYSSAIGQDRTGGPTAMRHLAERLRGRAFDAVLAGRVVSDLSQIAEHGQRKRKDLSYSGAIPYRLSDNPNDDVWIDPENWTWSATWCCLRVMLEASGQQDAKLTWLTDG